MFLSFLSNTNNFIWYYSFVFTPLNDFKYSYLKQRILFNISHMFAHRLNSSIWSIDGTLTNTTTPGQSGPGINGNEGVLQISQSSKTKVSPSDGLVSYLEHLLECYPSAEMQLAYSTAPTDYSCLNGYHTWNQESKFKFWMRLFAFYIVLQLWVNNRAD